MHTAVKPIIKSDLKFDVDSILELQIIQIILIGI